MEIRGDKLWTLAEHLGGGGFGQVYRAISDEGLAAAAKLVPKTPGAERELLFEKLHDVPNVVPIIDLAETDDAWVLVMPIADRSLADELVQQGSLPLDQAVAVLIDVATALAALEGNVVHRDLKPQNILMLEGRWCLADFGISRYAEASTAPDTRKFAMSGPYAAPERWRGERATAAADVYSFGVIAHELLSGAVPFPGPREHEFREQHLHLDPPPLQNVTTRLAALVEECLFKAPQSRPTPTNLLARLSKAGDVSRLPGASSLAAANQAAVKRTAGAAAAQSLQRTEHERRAELGTAAHAQFKTISSELLDALTTEAPSAGVTESAAHGWKASLSKAEFGLSQPVIQPEQDWGGWQPPAIDLISHATITIVTPPDRGGYRGRSHSFWYCDAKHKGDFGWFETAFMDTPMTNRQAHSQAPFALAPGIESAKALSSVITEFQVAWPFTRLVGGELDELVDRWLGWFAAAAEGGLHHPSTMPERQPDGSWRR